jgi:FkbM family methyltransferase
MGVTMEFVSHIGQDKWVCDTFQNLRNGYFLDFGAFDGTTISNTLILERELGWTGICVEPNPTYYPALCKARTSICINAALWHTSRQSVEIVDAHGLSSLVSTKDDDVSAARRNEATTRVVSIDTINPTELLDRFDAPQTIPFMSLDVEGCEFEILKAIDFKKYNILLMSVEHAENRAKQQKVRSFLSGFGYDVVQNKCDDFFFKKDWQFPRSAALMAEQIDREYPIRE